MANHTNAWSNTTPASNEKAGLGANEIKIEKLDIDERLQVDHYNANKIDEYAADVDGAHKKVTMKALASAPDSISGAGFVYTKDVDGITELFFKDDNDTEIQVTDNGQLTFPSYPVACKASKIATQAIASANTKVTFPSEDYDVNEDFDDSTFTSPVDAWYLITISLNINSGTDCYPMIWVNGSGVFTFRGLYTSSIYLTTFVLPLYLERDDEVEIYISSTGSYPFNILSGSFLNVTRL